MGRELVHSGIDLHTLIKEEEAEIREREKEEKAEMREREKEEKAEIKEREKEERERNSGYSFCT